MTPVDAICHYVSGGNSSLDLVDREVLPLSHIIPPSLTKTSGSGTRNGQFRVGGFENHVSHSGEHDVHHPRLLGKLVLRVRKPAQKKLGMTGVVVPQTNATLKAQWARRLNVGKHQSFNQSFCRRL